MRPEIAEPVRDGGKLQKLLPLAERIFRLHEGGQPYATELKLVSRIVGRIVDKPTVMYAFGVSDSEYFARRLLVDWDNLPTDLSEPEMLELLEAACSANASPDRTEYWLKCLARNTGEPSLSDLIYWPDQYREGAYEDGLAPSRILEIALFHGRQK